MRRFAGIFVFIFFAVLLSACSSLELEEFKSDSGNFSVLAPLELKETTQTIPIQGGNLDFHQFLGDSGNISFVVGYSDYLLSDFIADPNIILDATRDGIIKNLNGTLTVANGIDLNGNPGEEFLFDASADGASLTAKARIYLVNTRLFQVVALGSKGTLNMGQADAFLQSFKLLP